MYKLRTREKVGLGMLAVLIVAGVLISIVLSFMAGLGTGLFLVAGLLWVAVAALLLH